jgi:MraZ protein
LADIVGLYRITFEKKGRFLLPAGFRNDLPLGNREVFFVNKSPEKCLTLYIKDEWEILSARIKQIDSFSNKEQREFKRLFYEDLAKVSPDSNDRVILPMELVEYAGIDKNAVFWCQGDKVEIWDEVTYKEYMAELKKQRS